MFTAEEIQRAKNLGAQAFARGAASAPCLDRELMQMIEQKRPRLGEGDSILKAFSDGWHRANAAAPVL